MNSKIVIFSSFKEMLNLIGHELVTLGASFLKFTGELNSNQRSKVLKEFARAVWLGI